MKTNDSALINFSDKSYGYVQHWVKWSLNFKNGLEDFNEIYESPRDFYLL
jgi:hypothetical protein